MEENTYAIMDAERQKDIQEAKTYYIENRNLKLKHIMAGEMFDWTPEMEAEIEKIRNKIIEDYETRQEVMKQKAIDFKEKYGEDLYTYIISDITI